jgi:hypothetical protein
VAHQGLRLAALLCLGWTVCGAAPWAQPATPNLDSARLGVTGLTAADCGGCHTAVYGEWKHSAHAAAWVDPQFQAELHKDPEVGWLCLNCHTPVANQQAQLLGSTADIRNPEKTKNNSFNAEYRLDGVTCLGCHWRPEGIAAPHADVRAPHATVYAPDLADDALCNRCHQAKARLEDALVCHFNTGEEKTEAGVDLRCTSCHMPTVKRSVVDGGPVRVGGAHGWPGSGIGKGVGPVTPGLSGLTLDDVSAERQPDGSLNLALSLNNTRAGHKVPTGDPERFVQLSAWLMSEEGHVMDEKVWRMGQTWTWSPVAKKLSDNRLEVGERRALTWRSTAAGTAVVLKLRHVRLSEENSRYHIERAAQGHAGPSEAALRAYPKGRLLLEQRVLIR